MTPSYKKFLANIRCSTSIGGFVSNDLADGGDQHSEVLFFMSSLLVNVSSCQDLLVNIVIYE